MNIITEGNEGGAGFQLPGKSPAGKKNGVTACPLLFLGKGQASPHGEGRSKVGGKDAPGDKERILLFWPVLPGTECDVLAFYPSHRRKGADKLPVSFLVGAEGKKGFPGFCGCLSKEVKVSVLSGKFKGGKGRGQSSQGGVLDKHPGPNGKQPIFRRQGAAVQKALLTDGMERKLSDSGPQALNPGGDGLPRDLGRKGA